MCLGSLSSLYTTGCPEDDCGDDGANDGESDTVADGVSDGTELGASDGKALGVADGVVLGASDGIALGTSDGIELGASDGTSEGMLLGTSEGIELGRSDGNALGALVVGASKSTSVSLPVSSTMKLSAPITIKSKRTDATVNLSSLKASIHIVLFPLVDKYGSAWYAPSSFPLIVYGVECSVCTSPLYRNRTRDTVGTACTTIDTSFVPIASKSMTFKFPNDITSDWLAATHKETLVIGPLGLIPIIATIGWRLTCLNCINNVPSPFALYALVKTRAR